MPYWMIIGPEREAWAYAMRRHFSERNTVVVRSAEEMLLVDPKEIEGVAVVAEVDALGSDEVAAIAWEIFILNTVWPEILIIDHAGLARTLTASVSPGSCL